MLGWQTRSFPSLTVTHHRFTGAANGMWQNAVKNGTWSYICGYHPLFMVLRCLKRLLKKPVFVGSARTHVWIHESIPSANSSG